MHEGRVNDSVLLSSHPIKRLLSLLGQKNGLLVTGVALMVILSIKTDIFQSFLGGFINLDVLVYYALHRLNMREP